MKVLIVNTSDIYGGAARAAYRLHKSLLDKNIDSQMLVQNKSSDDFTVIGPKTKFEKLINKLKPTIDRLPFSITKNKTTTTTLFSCAWLPSKKLVKQINDINPDVVHLHWINGGMLKIEYIGKINAKIVWSLHDMWPFSGGWHYEEPLANVKQKRLDQRIIKRKNRIFSRIDDMTIVGLSRWLQQCAKLSEPFHNKEVVHLPNPIDSQVFKPIDMRLSRELWRLPLDKKLVLFGAMGATSDPRKGFRELVQALSLIEDDDIEFVVFGASEPKEPLDVDCKVHYMGTLSDDVSLVTLYSAVDVMLVPSRQEAFGQTASEAMSCGTPVVAFGHTGLLDIVDHKVNGYLATPFDTSDLATGIQWVINYESYEELSSNARNKVVETFDYEVVSDKYIQLYREIID